MAKRFNVTGLCIKEKHYMVDINEKINRILHLIDEGQYFTINRARQFGKTTTLFMLSKSLPDDFTCINLSFEGVGQTMFSSSAAFCQRFLLHVYKALENRDKDFANHWLNDSITDFDLLGFHLDKLCKDKKIILLIDEIDSTSNNQVFLHFLSMLRSKYLARENGYSHTFHSVILAGVYDIKNIKLKMMNEGIYTEEKNIGKIYNSPWNIAADFDVDMSFHPAEISSMLYAYENDHITDMNVPAIAEEIYRYTNGYPFLVSRICQCVDEKLDKKWTIDGIKEAVKVILSEHNTLFDDLSKNLENNKNLYNLLYSVLIIGEQRLFNIDDPVILQSNMFGYISQSKNNGKIMISNKIFEIRISNYFISKDSNNSRIENIIHNGLYYEIVNNDRFNMELCLLKFAEHYNEIFTTKDISFLERHGRLLFISYLRPMINGKGFYHIESQFTDLRRMDIVVDFGNDQFIIELKLWKGESNRKKAYEQLLNYMNTKKADKGYLLTFDFRKKKNNHYKAEWVKIGNQMIFDIVV